MSSSRYQKKKTKQKFTDEGGDTAEVESKRKGFSVAKRTLISDDPEMLRRTVERFVSGRHDVLLLTGGTGLSDRDVTIETVREYIDKELDGFGELLRRVSFRKVGAAAVLTRATAGVAKHKLIVCLPGSPDAVRTGLRAFGSEIPHALMVARS